MSGMKRREFITLLGGAAATWPLAARAQQSDKVKRIGALLPAAADDSEFQTLVGAFLQALAQSGWTIGHNVRIDTRWATNSDDIRKHAGELIALAPDVVLAFGTSTVGPLLQITRTVPIVFPVAADPVGAGFVNSLARPGGNATGFTSFEYGIGGKWLELLKEIAPGVTQAAVLRDPNLLKEIAPHVARVAMLFNPVSAAAFAEYWLTPFEAAAPSFGVEAIAAPVRDSSELEPVIAAQAREPNAGLIAMPDSFTDTHRAEITSLATRYRLPAVYPFRLFAEAGGLLSYGLDRSDKFRRAATYVDRILKGEKPSELPVQAPVKFDLVINLRTAKELGLDVPLHLQQRADEVIE